MACVAEDLSMPSSKKHKKFSSSKKNLENSFYNPRSNPMLKTEIITQIMDIQEPLSTLKNLLQSQLGVDLSNFQIWLQDKFKMQPQKSLGEQCIQSEGLAQVKVELKQLLGNNRINIVDVLRLPDEEIEDDDDDSPAEDLSIKTSDTPPAEIKSEKIPSRWTICENFNSLFPIPFTPDPIDWSVVQIRHWLTWALQEFNVPRVNDSMWEIAGKQLCQMSIEEFQKRVPLDPHNHLWTHIELLKKCRIFAVIDKSRKQPPKSLTQIKPSQNTIRKPRTSSSSSTSSKDGNLKRPFMTGHNGQIQLWQFLLELLGDRRRKNVIQWVGRDGEFKLNDPELVAQMWGERKNKPKMNYEKLSRALRYYYSEAMIAKVHGRRFVYKFVCNLKELIGYTAEELISMVDEDIPFQND